MAVSPAQPVFRFVGVLAGVVLVIGCAYLLVNVVARDTYVARTSYRDVRKLTVVAGAGDIKLVPAPAGSPVQVEEHVTETLRSPHRARSFRAGRLVLRSRCDGWVPVACGVNYVVFVPPGTRVVATTGGDDVRASRLATDRPLRLSSGSGGISAESVSAPRLVMDTGSGDVGGVDLQARSLSAESGSGDVVLELTRPAKLLHAESGGGDIILTVPDVPYALQASGAGGGVFNDGVRDDPRSKHAIDAQSGGGSVRLEVSRIG